MAYTVIVGSVVVVVVVFSLVQIGKCVVEVVKVIFKA